MPSGVPERFAVPGNTLIGSDSHLLLQEALAVAMVPADLMWLCNIGAPFRIKYPKLLA